MEHLLQGLYGVDAPGVRNRVRVRVRVRDRFRDGVRDRNRMLGFGELGRNRVSLLYSMQCWCTVHCLVAPWQRSATLLTAKA